VLSLARCISRAGEAREGSHATLLEGIETAFVFGVILRPTILQLTPFELTVLRQVAQRKTTRAIAEELGRTTNGINWTLSRVNAKLQVKTRRDAVNAAIARGLLRGKPLLMVPNPLTDLECEIIDLVADGLGKHRIARHMSCSPGNISSRIRIIKDKLKARSTDEIVEQAEHFGFYTLGKTRPRFVAAEALGRPAEEFPDIDLSARRYEVLWCMSRRYLLLREIAALLDITPSTVAAHVAGIRREFGTKTLRQAVQKAREMGFLPQVRAKETLDRFGLTRRQRDLLAAGARGDSREQMARAFHCSIKTITTYATSIQFRLGVTSFEDAVALARRRGILAAALPVAK
jgi:DNA-binding CsgD family transcriptional regulator